MRTFCRSSWLIAFLACVLASCASDPGAEAAVDASPEPSEPASTTAAGDSSAATEADEPGLPVTVLGDDGVQVTIESAERIIPLDGDVAEIVFALGLGDQVVATDLSATYPPEADALPEIGYQRALSAEPITTFEPTVLLGTDIAGPPEEIENLRELGIPLVIVPSPNEATGPATKIRAVAEALGVSDRGEALAAEVQAAIDAAMQRAEGFSNDRPAALALYLRGETAQLVLGEGSSIDWILDAAGAEDLGEELGGGSSAPIQAEQLLAAAPEVLVVTAAGLESVGGTEGLKEIPGVARTPAAESDRILAYDDQLLLGNGPRTGQLLEQLVTDIHAR